MVLVLFRVWSTERLHEDDLVGEGVDGGGGGMLLKSEGSQATPPEFLS